MVFAGRLNEMACYTAPLGEWWRIVVMLAFFYDQHLSSSGSPLVTVADEHDNEAVLTGVENLRMALV